MESILESIKMLSGEGHASEKTKKTLKQDVLESLDEAKKVKRNNTMLIDLAEEDKKAS